MRINIIAVFKTILQKVLIPVFAFLGVLFTLFVILSFTAAPFWMYYNLGNVTTGWSGKPDYIIVLGGGGIPSESGLMRTYRAYQEAVKFDSSKVIIALPGNIYDSLSSVNLMKYELVWRGIDSTRIILEPEGTNTRMQAINIKKITGYSSVYIITSPEHTKRAVKTFAKVGYTKIYGSAAFEKALESELEFKSSDVGGNKAIPNVGENLNLRYQFWNHMKYQIIVCREYIALAYYKLKGWI